MIITANDIDIGDQIRNPYDIDQRLLVQSIDSSDWLTATTLPGDQDPSQWKIEIDMIKIIYKKTHICTTD